MFLLCGAALLWTFPSQAVARCGTYPPAVEQTTLYGGFSDCDLKETGHRPLWQGLPDDRLQIIRFTFTEGHGMFFRVVTIEQKLDGSAELVVGGTERVSSIRSERFRKAWPPRRVRLSREEMAEIDRLGAETGAWKFDVGTWDESDGETIYMHCQTLDMERANAEAYRYSSVSIGCNQPTKLMPLVDEIVRLAGLEKSAEGMLYY
jgi:hypothetical protein